MGGSEAPKPFRHRHDGLTPARQLLFLARLRETGCVADACRTAGISTTSVRRARKRMPEFADRWDVALAEPRPVLRQAAFERAVYGVEEPVVRYGKIVAVRRRYSDGLLRLLLEQEAGRRDAADRPRTRTLDEVRDSILAKLTAMDEHDERVRREEALAFAERMRREGWAP